MFRVTTIAISALAFSTGNLYAASFTIAPEHFRDLRDQRAALVLKIKELDAIGRQIEARQSEKKSAASSIKRQETESNLARVKLGKLQDFDRENPGDIPPEQLRAAEDKYKQAFRALKESKEKLANAESKINNVLNVEADSQYNEFLRLKSSFERDVDREVDTQLQERIRVIQVSKEVQATERVACGDDSIPVCKERSKKAAELKATERGSVVFINSMTEVKNFKLSKEELRSEVQATLSDKVFSNQRLVGETEYETTINASVTPAISDSLRKQMAESLRLEVYAMMGGKIDLVKNPAVKTASYAQTEEDEEVEFVPVKPRKKLKTVTEAPPQQEPVSPPPQQQQQQQPPPPVSAPRKAERPTFSF